MGEANTRAIPDELKCGEVMNFSQRKTGTSVAATTTICMLHWIFFLKLKLKSRTLNAYFRGGNLQPVRMICEYDWKECPIAVVSYVWSEIVTDVVDGIIGEVQLWRILAVVVFCSMLFHMCYKMRFTENKIERNFPTDELVKFDFKIQDLELKINILTYKMQYGNWPMPHEIPTPSLNELRNIKLTLSNTSRKNMWTKHHLHGYISKCVGNPEEEDKSKLRESGKKRCKDYKKLIRTADECRKYMEEINESNKSLGLFDNSTDASDNQYSSEETSHRFLVDPKKWHEIYKSKNREEEVTSEIDVNASDKTFSLANFRYEDSVFPVVEDHEHPLKSSKNRSRLLPPGLSITFLSDKFKALSTNDKCVLSKTKTCTNETLNRAKEELENLHDMDNSNSFNNRNDKCNEPISSECEEETEDFEEEERRASQRCRDHQKEPSETSSKNVARSKENLAKNINLSFMLCPKDKSSHQTPMETDEDGAIISGASSRTELTKDSDTDEKSTTTLLREALDFKKALMMQIHEKEVEDKSECDSDDPFKSKIDKNFRPKVLDIISEEQSAGSSTEKTSRTYILSRTINETNLREEYERNGSKRDDKQSESPCCGDSKSVVKSSSSEYFSTHNMISIEHPSTQKVGQCVADGDGLREPKIDSKEEPESTKLEFVKSVSSIISEKAISWNSVSESSSDESIAQFVNAIANMESKNMCDYEGKSFVRPRKDFRNIFLESNIKILHDDAAAEKEKFETICGREKQEKNEEGLSNQLQSHSGRLQRKRDMLSKLKSLDAFTKPIDVSDCNLEQNENDEDSSPLTGRTVVCVCRSDSKTKKQAIDHVSEAQREKEEKESAEYEAKKNLEIKKTIVCSKKKNLSMSSITNFSTDTSDSYFDVSNHDFAVSSIILTSKNSNLVEKQRADPSKSDTSSTYVDASDRSISKIATNSISAVKQEPSKPESSTKVPKSNKKSVAKSQSEQNQSSRTSDQLASKCWSNLNLDKSNSRAKTQSKSLIPVLKSRVDIPRRGKSMESRTRSRSSTRSTPRIQSARSNLNCQTEDKKNDRQSKKGATPERQNPKPVSADKKESNKIAKSEASKPSTAHLTKECTVIYINIVSDTEENGAQTPEGKEITRYKNRDDSNRQSLSLGDMKSNGTQKRTRAMNLGGPTSDSRLCEDARNANENSSSSSNAFLENATANKLLSTSTLELINPSRVEQREMEVSVKPSVKNTSTSVSDFPDPSLESKRSFYNPNIEMFDVSNDLVRKEKIVLSEMLSTTTDPIFFECKKTQRLYNKLGLGFQEQSEQL